MEENRRRQRRHTKTGDDREGKNRIGNARNGRRKVEAREKDEVEGDGERITKTGDNRTRRKRKTTTRKKEMKVSR